jgi:hypothetical protein
MLPPALEEVVVAPEVGRVVALGVTEEIAFARLSLADPATLLKVAAVVVAAVALI